MIPKTGTYVCIEGLDGAGKSTLLKALVERLEKQHILFSVACPTKPIRTDSLIERVFSRFAFLRKASLFRACVYALRSKQVAKNTNWNVPLILGDRSIVTSYVTRWRRWWNSARLTIRFVDYCEPFIPVPDHIFYIDLPEYILRERLNMRGQPLDIDETVQRSRDMRRAYDEICNTKIIPRIHSTKWHKLEITANSSPEEVANEAWKILLHLVPTLCVEMSL